MMKLIDKVLVNFPNLCINLARKVMDDQKRKINLLVISNVLCWTLLGFFLITGFQSKQTDQFKEITAERINIVNEDGTTVIAISNKQKIAGPMFDGVDYPVVLADGRKYMAGMIFFNEEGDEMGGLVFNSFKLPDGRTAGIGHLSFDRFKDNQVINLEYKENNAGVRSGLTIYDRPGNGIFPKSLALANEFLYDKSISEERKSAIRDSLAMMRKDNGFGLDRLFLGSFNEEPQLTMKDVEGNQRIKLFVDSTNTARLVFFDENGNEVGSFPEN